MSVRLTSNPCNVSQEQRVRVTGPVEESTKNNFVRSLRKKKWFDENKVPMVKVVFVT